MDPSLPLSFFDYTQRRGDDGLALDESNILFQSHQDVAEGVQIELTIAWPVRLNDVAGLTWHVTGRTLRSQGKCAAVKMLRREFRIRPLAGRPVVSLRTRH
jgi:hypothetical protein